MDTKHSASKVRLAQAAIMSGLLGAQLLFAGPALALEKIDAQSGYDVISEDEDSDEYWEDEDEDDWEDEDDSDEDDWEDDEDDSDEDDWDDEDDSDEDDWDDEDDSDEDDWEDDEDSDEDDWEDEDDSDYEDDWEDDEDSDEDDWEDEDDSDYEDDWEDDEDSDEDDWDWEGDDWEDDEDSDEDDWDWEGDDWDDSEDDWDWEDEDWEDGDWEYGDGYYAVSSGIPKDAMFLYTTESATAAPESLQHPLSAAPASTAAPSLPNLGEPAASAPKKVIFRIQTPANPLVAPATSEPHTAVSPADAPEVQSAHVDSAETVTLQPAASRVAATKATAHAGASARTGLLASLFACVSAAACSLFVLMRKKR